MPDAGRRDFRTLSPAEQHERRHRFRDKLRRDAAGTDQPIRGRSKGGGGYGMGDD
jgi:hypothetical protein